MHYFGLKTIGLKSIAFFYVFLDLEIDPCIGNDCDPTNGECVPSGNTFMCMCKAGYTGDGKSCTRNQFFFSLLCSSSQTFDFSRKVYH